AGQRRRGPGRLRPADGRRGAVLGDPARYRRRAALPRPPPDRPAADAARTQPAPHAGARGGAGRVSGPEGGALPEQALERRALLVEGLVGEEAQPVAEQHLQLPPLEAVGEREAGPGVLLPAERAEQEPAARG